MPDRVGQSDHSGDVPWLIAGAFRIEAENEEDAQRALSAIERTARRTYGSTTVHVHVSEEFCDA